MERTLSIIKPDGVRKKIIGKILDRFERNGFSILAAKVFFFKKPDVDIFYQSHTDKPFYPELLSFMTSGPSFVTLLQRENAIQKNRDMMGDTDPKKAKDGTLRKDFAKSIDENIVHGSDSIESAKREIKFFFQEL